MSNRVLPQRQHLRGASEGPRCPSALRDLRHRSKQKLRRRFPDQGGTKLLPAQIVRRVLRTAALARWPCWGWPSCSITLLDESRTSIPATGTNVPSPRRRTMLFDPVENCAPVTRSMWKIRTPKVGSEYPLAALLNVPG